MSSSLIQSTEKDGDTQIVVVAGEIDFSCSPDLRVGLMKLLDEPHGKLIVDLGGVPYMDSSGVAVLVEALQRQRSAGHPMVLCGLTTKVRSIFEISRLDAVFKIVDDMDSAKQA